MEEVGYFLCFSCEKLFYLRTRFAMNSQSQPSKVALHRFVTQLIRTATTGCSDKIIPWKWLNRLRALNHLRGGNVFPLRRECMKGNTETSALQVCAVDIADDYSSALCTRFFVGHCLIRVTTNVPSDWTVIKHHEGGRSSASVIKRAPRRCCSTPFSHFHISRTQLFSRCIKCLV